ncbi:hypothetical protein QAD02_001848 [Eretmocerus hayati]|uniref:Uncharacterized protein n=1 Tax=Eretmocerus hayati TaxID=131215 RepID=A0ACC2NHI5_9HYME|nr:hypothetical protein QAD02_001848 [Eretmocerus hayati]
MIRFFIASYTLAVVLCQKVSTEETFTPNLQEEHVTEEISTIATNTSLESFDGNNYGGDNSHFIEEPREVRIDQGSRVSIKQYPYVVSLHNNKGYQCVGTIITSRLILTAFHCIHENLITIIRVGSSDKYQGGQIYSVAQNIKYPYAKSTLWEISHDVALLLLHKKIKNALPVTLVPSKMRVPENAIVRAVGWGRNRRDRDPRYLMRVALELAPVDKCQNSYDTYFLCTETKRSSTCEGDSGGPILWNYGNVLYQVGTVSHSTQELCGNGEPAGNVNVRKYLSWITGYMKMYQ